MNLVNLMKLVDLLILVREGVQKKTVFFQENFLNFGRRGRVKFLILLVIHYPHLIKLILITHFLVSTNRC